MSDTRCSDTLSLDRFVSYMQANPMSHIEACFVDLFTRLSVVVFSGPLSAVRVRCQALDVTIHRA